MNIKPIKDEQSHESALERTEQLWGAVADTPEGDELDILLTLVEAYEAKHYPMPPSDPVEAIKFRCDQLGLTNKDLEPYIGSKGRVSEVLSRKRGISYAMMIRLHKGLNIPYESLVDESKIA